MSAPLVLPPNLPPALAGVAWMIGTWEGVGVGVQQGQEFQFGQRLSFRFDGQPCLAYACQVWQLDEQGHPGALQAQESGYWRSGADSSTVEVLLANAEGYVEVYLGTAQPGSAQVEVATDMVGRTSTGVAYTAGKRLYGLVEGELLYAHDAMFEADAQLAPLRSARLQRVSSTGEQWQ